MTAPLSFLKKFAFAMVPLTVLILLLEFLVLPFFKINPRIAYKLPFVEDPVTDYQHQPGYQGIMKSGLAGVKPYAVSINSLGFREKEITQATPPHTYRIIFIGDSVTFGSGLPYDKTISGQLAELLNSDNGQNMRFETVNAGVSGFTTRHEKLFLEEHILKKKVAFDLLVLEFTLNDFPSMSYTVHKKDFLGSVISFLQRNSAIYHFAGFLLYKMNQASYQDEAKPQTPGEKDDLRFNGAYFQRILSSGYDQSAHELSQIQDLATSHGRKMMILIVPFRDQVLAEIPYRKPQEFLLNFARSHKIPALDLLDTLRDAKRKNADEPLFFDFTHPTPRGSRLIAVALKNFIPENFDLLKGSKQVSISP